MKLNIHVKRRRLNWNIMKVEINTFLYSPAQSYSQDPRKHLRQGAVKYRCKAFYLRCLRAPLLRERYYVFSRIRTEYGEIRSISPYPLRIRENTDQKNSVFAHFSCSAWLCLCCHDGFSTSQNISVKIR